jgi:hypothetical protein
LADVDETVSAPSGQFDLPERRNKTIDLHVLSRLGAAAALRQRERTRLASAANQRSAPERLLDRWTKRRPTTTFSTANESTG